MSALSNLPSELVIRFVKTHFKERNSYHLADLSCGNGRHMLFMLREGHVVAGTDSSTRNVESAQQLLTKHGFEPLIIQANLTNLPFENEQFDGLLCEHMLMFLNQQELEQAIGELYRILKPGGKCFITVRNTNDTLFRTGNTLEDHTFIHFFTEEEIHQLFKAFMNVTIGVKRFSQNSLTQYSSEYLITLVK
ncbi:class I SAM-dependent methyltransferase [Paenibacillus sp. HJGM_3]|uniref:class I SAM-dependent methyltransferase n=1 Tax=Paenibacillus sp. HJGM_3 TaxID=3379816 RepID=UPI00385862B0